MAKQEQPMHKVSSWWFDAKVNDIEDIDDYINQDIKEKAAQGYEFVSMTALPLGKKCVMCLHFRLRNPSS